MRAAESQRPARERSRALSPLDVLRLLVARRGTVLGATAAAAALAGGLALVQAPTFEATTTVLLDPSARGGLIGNLAMLSPIGSSVVATSEVAVLRSRAVVESVVRPPVKGEPPTPETPGFERHVGLTTVVHDEARSTLSLLLAELRGPVDGRPPVQPAYRLFADARATTPDAPRAVRVEFLSAERVRLSTPTRLGLGDEREREVEIQPGAPIDYYGLALALVPEGPIAGQSFVVEAVAEYEAAEGLLERFWAAETTRNSGVIRLTVSDSDPFRAAETANALVQNYLDQQVERRARRSIHTLALIERMLDESSTAMDAAQAELVRVRTENPATVDLDATGEALIAELSKLEAAAIEVELRHGSLSGVLEGLRAGDTIALARLDSAISGGLFVDPITEGYLERIAALNGQHAELAQTLAPEHPTLVDVRGTAEELVGLVAEQIESRLAGMAAQVAEIRATRDARLAELARLPQDMLALAKPTLEVRTQQELIPTLIANLKATEIADSSSGFVAQVLDRAGPATAVASPRLKSIVAVGGALGLLCGLLVALCTEGRRGRVRGAADLAELVPRPMLASLPYCNGSRPSAELSESVRSLRTAIKNLRASGGPVRALGLTSIGARDDGGVALELARSFARSGARVALVDGDLVEGALTRRVGLAGRPGLAEALRGRPPELVQDDARGLSILPSGELGADALDLAGGDALARVLAELGRDRDLVLFDLPEAGSTLVEATAARLDGLLLACGGDRAARAAVDGALERIERAGGYVLGTMIVLFPRLAVKA